MSTPSVTPPPSVAPTKLQFEFSYVPFLGDLALRYSLLALLRVSWIPNWLFWCGQIFVVPLIVMMWIGWRQTVIREKYNAADKQVEPKDSAHWIIAMILLMIHAGYQTFARVNFTPNWLRGVVASLLAIAAAFYILAVAFGSISDKKAVAKDEVPAESYDAVDENDRLLIWLQTEVADFERMVESYTIESTLIGALAFSAFVTIISSDKATLPGVSALLTRVWEAFHSLLTLNPDALRMIARPPSNDTVMVAIACLALIASMFFVAVIVARLRFNSLVGLANYSTEMAAAFNNKEEEIDRHLLFSQTDVPALQMRLSRLRTQINDSLGEAQLGVNQLRPIIAYMRVFRHLGVVTFLAALVASALWVSPVLAAGFTLIGILAYGYPAVDRWVRDSALRKHGFFLVEAVLKRRR